MMHDIVSAAIEKLPAGLRKTGVVKAIKAANTLAQEFAYYADKDYEQWASNFEKHPGVNW